MKPPITSNLRKQSKRVLPTKRPNVYTTTDSSTPIIVAFQFESGNIAIPPPNRHTRQKETIDQNTIYDLNLFCDPPLHDQMKTMTIDEPMSSAQNNESMDVLSPIRNKVQLEKNDPIITDLSPFKATDYSSNVLLPLPIDNGLMSDTSTGENDQCDDDRLPNFLLELKEENVKIMKQFDDRIDAVCETLKQAGREMRKLIKEKEKKRKEFVEIFNEHLLIVKENKSNGKAQKKSVKRLGGGINNSSK